MMCSGIGTAMKLLAARHTDLSGLREDTLSFYMQDGEPVFLSHTELNIEEPPFTPLPNDGTYDVTQPLQEWELTRTNGVQTGMTQAQVEEITGPLTTDQYGYWLLDSQNVSYSFGQNGYQTPQLMEMNWSADVRNDELFYVTAQDTPAFRGICLGDTIDEVLDKFPCVDRELKRWADAVCLRRGGHRQLRRAELCCRQLLFAVVLPAWAAPRDHRLFPRAAACV